MSKEHEAVTVPENELSFAGSKREVSLNAIQQVGVASILPVLYTDNAGGGTNEFQAPTTLTRYRLDFDPPLPDGVNLISCWFMVVDNLPDQSGFLTIDVFPANNRQVFLFVKGTRGTNKRIRLRISGLFTASA